MKRSLFLCLFVFLLAGLELNAQVFVGGSFNVSTEKEKSTLGSTTNDGDKTLNLGITPKVGFFINNNFALGVGFGISTLKVTTPKTDYYEEEVYRQTSWAFTPFARYYFAKSGGFSLFGEGTVGIGGGKTKNTVGSNTSEGPKIFSMTVGVSPNLSFDLGDKVSLEAGLGGLVFSSFTSTQKGVGESEEDLKTTTSGIGLNLGMDDLTFGVVIKL